MLTVGQQAEGFVIYNDGSIGQDRFPWHGKDCYLCANSTIETPVPHAGLMEAAKYAARGCLFSSPSDEDGDFLRLFVRYEFQFAEDADRSSILESLAYSNPEG